MVGTDLIWTYSIRPSSYLLPLTPPKDHVIHLTKKELRVVEHGVKVGT